MEEKLAMCSHDFNSRVSTSDGVVDDQQSKATIFYGSVECDEECSMIKSNSTPVVEIENEAKDDLITKRDLSNTRAFAHLFRFMTGPSMFGTPKTLANGGILFGPIGFVALGYLNAWCNNTVVRCNRMLCRRLEFSSMSYNEMVENSLLLYIENPRYTKAARILGKASQLALAITQIGVASFYIKLIGGTLAKVLLDICPTCTYNQTLIETLVAVLLVPYCWIRNLKLLFWFSLIGNLISVFCVVVILQYMCSHLHSATRLPLITQDISTIPLFISTAVFVMEGIPMIVPLENRMRHPEDYGGVCGLITLASTCNIGLNVGLGFYSYLSVGQGVNGNILVNLPNTWLYTCLNMAVALMIFVTYPIHLHVPSEILNSYIVKRAKNKIVRSQSEVLSRSLITVVCYLLAAAVPKVDLLMSLVGSCGSTLLLFFFPPLTELFVERVDKGHFPWYILLKDLLIFSFGILVFSTGAYSSLVNIFQSF